MIESGVNKGAMLRSLLVIAALGAGLAPAWSQNAEETQSSNVGASTWRTGSMKPSVTVAAGHAMNSGGGASWTAGKGAIALGRQAGGVWRDGSSLSEAPVGPASSHNGSALPAGAPVGFAGLMPASGIGGIRIAPGRAQGTKPGAIAHTSIGARSALRQQGGVGGRGGLRGAGSKRVASTGGARGRGSLKGGLRPAASSTGLASPTQDNSIFKPLTALSPSDSLGSGAASPVDESSH